MWKCPQCGSIECLLVTVQVRCHLVQGMDDDNFETETIDANHDWDGSSPMMCTNCNQGGCASEFEVCDPGGEEKYVIITVEDGVVQNVVGLPDGYSYSIDNLG